MCFGYDGYNDITNDTTPKARKAHKCYECGGEIRPGETYHRHAGLFDGGFFDFKVCRRCDYDRVRVAEHELADGCFGSEIWCPLGGLTDYLSDSGMGQTNPEDVPASFRVGDKPKAVAR